jgi:hypothetical protein
MHHPFPTRTAGAGKSAPWFHLFLAALALTAWLTLSLRDTETRLSRAAERLAVTESRLEKSRTEVRDLKESVDEVKEMVGTLVEDIDEGQAEDDEFADEDEGDEGPYLVHKAGRSPTIHRRAVPL